MIKKNIQPHNLVQLEGGKKGTLLNPRTGV